MFMPGDLYDSLKDLKNTEILGRQDLYYSYLGFKLGHFDKNKGINITDPKAKMGDKKLRQAMAYGLNIDQMVQTFYSGIRERATSMVPPVMTKYFPKGLKGYPYDPKKAKELLDEAGYKDINGDGYREDKNGKPFVIKMASMSGGDIAEPLAQFYIQNWKDIGLKVVLTTGRLIELNTFYDKLGADDKDIDVFFAAWGVGSSLIPSSTAGKDAQFNYSRYVTEENERLMDDVVSPKTLTNPNYKAEAYKRWQEYYIDQAVVVPLTYKYVIYPVNKRLKNVYIGYDSAKLGKDINKWELTAKKPIR
jgi:oligopeptide-binding protein OppA